MVNPILNTDSYKASHYLQYPPNTKFVSSYIESRGGYFQDTLFFGLQSFLKKYLVTPVTLKDIEQAESCLLQHGLPFNREGWEYILDKHNGLLPLKVEAVPEGTIVPVNNVLVQVCNTDPQCFWLTNYIETSLLRAVWYPTTVATLSLHIKAMIKKFLNITANDDSGLEFMLHDFGARGASSEETAALGGLAHLVNFQGSDNLNAIVLGQDMYACSMAGYSIPAAEHSTMTSWGREQEAQAYEQMLDQFLKPGKTVAVVSDSYDLWHALENIWGRQLKERIINSGGTLVIRPDSGDPAEIVVTTINKLMDKFGFKVNSKGYKELPAYIRVIQGDGICFESIEAVLQAMQDNKQSAINIAFGMGGALLQQVNRDTQRFAMKASAVFRDQHWHSVYKAPKTDVAKSSKGGRLALIKKANGLYQTIQLEDLQNQNNILQTIFEDGQLKQETTLEKVRNLVANQS